MQARVLPAGLFLRILVAAEGNGLIAEKALSRPESQELRARVRSRVLRAGDVRRARLEARILAWTWGAR